MRRYFNFYGDNVSVTVVVTTHNRPKLLRRALESIARQVELPDEVIVVDDCSERNVKHIVDDVLNDVKHRTIINETPRGANYSRNKGVSESTGDVVVFLDDDDEFLNKKISVIKSVYKEKCPDIIYHPALSVCEEFNAEYITSPKKHVTLEDILCENVIGATSVVAVRKGFFKENNLFDDNLPALQDWDAWISLVINGADAYYVDTPLTKYYIYLASKSTSKSIERHVFSAHYIHNKYAQFIGGLNEKNKRKRNAGLKKTLSVKYMMNRERFHSCRCAAFSFLLSPNLAAFSLIPLSVMGVGCYLKFRAFLSKR